MIKEKKIYQEWFHGTNVNNAQIIIKQGVNVKLGGGELGQGFYVGNYHRKAIAWAFHKNNKQEIKNSVLTLTISPYLKLKYKYIGLEKGKLNYANIKKNKLHKSFKYNVDLVQSKVMGINYYGFRQLKFESDTAEKLLNGKLTIK